MSTNSTPLWLHEEGRIACAKHGGNYLACAIEAEPQAVEHQTPLGFWALATQSDIDYLAENNLTASCETCGAC
jgi:hypothetical protein